MNIFGCKVEKDVNCAAMTGMGIGVLCLAAFSLYAESVENHTLEQCKKVEKILNSKTGSETILAKFNSLGCEKIIERNKENQLVVKFNKNHPDF